MSSPWPTGLDTIQPCYALTSPPRPLCLTHSDPNTLTSTLFFRHTTPQFPLPKILFPADTHKAPSLPSGLCWNVTWWSLPSTPYLKAQFSLLIKLHIHFLLDPAITLPGIYPREMKIYVHTKSCTWISIAGLFIIAKKWKQPRWPSIGWMNKQNMDSHTMGCSPIRRN